ncbi:hypothetical protein L9F63_012333 [Diploptera punctata]|uniref:Uncharacterized protein n=1 Tax=Diploptera punctata TaxID=6984 RepID=A0AAD8ENG4_DIPPU|nr:hypothetical protein L9F63_012333 [Diploptera punctata]
MLSILLLYGAYNELKREVGFYIKTRVLYVVFSLLTVLFFGSRLWTEDLHTAITVIMVGLPIVACDMYFWLIVYSYYQILKQNQTNEQDDTNLLI